MWCKPQSRWLAAAVLSLAGGTGAGQTGGETAGQGTVSSPQPVTQVSPRRALFEEHLQLEEKLAAALADSDEAARAFGQMLPVRDRRRLQAGCSSLARNPDNTGARELLREFVERHRDQRPRVVARYCFDPSLRLLQQEVRETRRALQEGSANGAEGEFDFRLRQLERAVRNENRRYAAISGILLAGSDTP